METLTIESVLGLIVEQSKQFRDNLELSRREFDEALQKERLEREQTRKEFEEEFRKSKERLRKLEGNWGLFVESLVRPGLIELFAKHEIGLRDIYSNIIEYKDKQKYYEIDLFAIDDIYVVAVEVKTSLTTAYVDEHLERLKKIQELPPHNFNLKGKTILGAIAGITIRGDSDKYAQRKGLFVLTQKGNLLEMLSPAHPKEWKIT